MGAEELTDAFNQSVSADVQPDNHSVGENGQTFGASAASINISQTLIESEGPATTQAIEEPEIVLSDT